MNVKYLTLIDTNSENHNLKLDDRSYLTTFACKYAQFKFVRLLFREVHPTGDMLQGKTDEIFKKLLNIFRTTDDILVEGYKNDGADHDKTIRCCTNAEKKS